MPPESKLRRVMTHDQWVARVMAERSVKKPTMRDPGRRHLLDSVREAERAIDADLTCLGGLRDFARAMGALGGEASQPCRRPEEDGGVKLEGGG
jgi:hypothetical protein